MANSLIFENARAGSLVINKRSSVDKKVPLEGVNRLSGDGIHFCYGQAAQGIVVEVKCLRVIRAPNGYVRDMTPKTIKIKQGMANSLIFENARAGSLVLFRWCTSQ